MTVHFTVNKTLLPERSRPKISGYCIQIFYTFIEKKWSKKYTEFDKTDFVKIDRVKRSWVRIQPITVFYFKDTKDRHKYPKVARTEKIM